MIEWGQVWRQGQWVLIDRQYMSMDEDLSRGLLGKKGGFERMYEDCLVRIQRIKQKNDAIQKQVGTEIEQSLREQIHQQRDFLQNEIQHLKKLMTNIEQKYRDPESRNKMKQVKADAQKQIERNKIILKDLIKDSFVKRSQGRKDSEDEPGQYMTNGEVNYNQFENGGQSKGDKAGGQTESLLTDQVEVDYELERKMALEKNQMINEVEQQTVRINDIMNDMGVMVEEQGQNLDIIEGELLKTNQNMVATNENLDEASKLQKKSKKKYIILVVILIIIIIAVAGIIFIAT